MKNQWNCSLLHRHLTQSCSEVKGRKACASKTVDKRQSYLREKKIRTYSVNYRLRLRYIKNEILGLFYQQSFLQEFTIYKGQKIDSYLVLVLVCL